MKLKSLLFVLCLALLAGCQKDPDTESTPARDTDRVEGVIRMKLDRETAEALNVTRTRSGRVLTGNISFDELCKRYEVTGMERLFADNGCAERTRKAGLDLWYVIRFKGSAEQVAEDFGEIAGVNHVEIPRKITKVGDVGRRSGTPWRKLMALPKAVPANYPFNDPLFAEQWPLYNDGSVSEEAVAGADINVIPAWKKTAGRSDVIVAVLDEGVEYTHPDLAANMWSGIGKNFCSGYNEDITWGQGHGTHVAGTIAAVNNNDVGISGMAGGTGSGDGVKIMSCQIFHDDDGGSAAISAKAIKYAADNGAAIIQCSYGYPAGSVTSDAAYSSGASAEKQAIDYFIAKQNCAAISGGLAIFAAGNDMTGMSSYPGAYRDYISVTAMSCDYTPAYYTDYGPGCNIAAPGGDAYQSYLENITSGASEVLSTVNGGKYGYMQGTSMACPHVSGVAALGLSYALQLGKTFTQNEFTTLLLTSVNDINQYCTGTKQYVTDKGSLATLDLSQHKKGMGTGYIDAYQVLMNVRGITCIPIPVGSQYTLNLQPYLGGGNLDLKITEISISADDMNRLGISSTPTIFANQIILKCTKPGSAVVRIKLLAGNGNNSGMNGMPITKEFAFIAREIHSQNGGWL